MRRVFLLLALILSATQLSFGQTIDSNRFAENEDNTFFRKPNSWAIGAGVSNFIMHGDLRSIGTNKLGNFYNFGGYVYLDKMFNPMLGLELRLNYNKMSGGSQYLSSVYDVLYLPNKIIRNGVEETVDRENLLFRGRSYGAELNFILSFTNLYELKSRKWNLSGYFGVGYHQYNSALYEKLKDGSEFLFGDADFGNNSRRNSVNEASSIYLSTQLGVKRKISRRIDIEFRTGIYFNNEDHLDATISKKEDWETFFVSSLGIVLKLGKGKGYEIWNKNDKRGGQHEFKVSDIDKDGVLDDLDIHPNTPRGVMVYANGSPVDSDTDGVPDYKDKCPFVKGLTNNDGCPFNGDIDKDGISDREDKCPDVKGLEKYKGCPNKESLYATEITTVLNYSKNIYFDTDSNDIKSAYYYTMLDGVVTIMLKNKDVTFSVTGYTDDRGKAEYNLDLSQRRAEQARTYLITRGVEPDRIYAEGYGEEDPKFTNDTDQGRQLNRRVEIKSVGVYKQKTKVYLNIKKE